MALPPLLRAAAKSIFVLTIATMFQLSSIASAATISEIEKSPNDSRDYRHLTLENGLKVTLIHDAGTETAAASLDVAIGAGSDPEDRQGLAHFLEHMLFLGTEKYPDAGDYSSFIQKNGGSNNAYTTFSNTNYHFEVNAAQLEPTLDRFAQFFIAPLFSEDLVQREKNAVHSEFTGKQKDDSRRFWSARKMGLNPAHPMTGFTTGNLTTLSDREGENIRDELINFYNTHYSANIMSLAIIGRQPLDELQSWVIDKFSAIKNRNSEKQKFNFPLYTANELGKRVNIKPLTDQRFLILTFPLPKIEEHRFTRPRSYLGNILGHEGPGSLLSELKQQGWVTGLSAGGGTTTRAATTFEISIGLTKDGVARIDDIVSDVFKAINRVRQSGLPVWLYEENQLIDQLSFRYQEKSNPAALVRALSVTAQEWPAEKMLSGPYQRTYFDTDGINRVLEHLNPSNLQILAVAPDLPTDQTTQWYDTPYSIKAIPPATLDRWNQAGVNPRIVIPEPNQFLPENLDLLAMGTGDPIKLIDTPKLQVWHRTDSSFGVPRANFKANIHLPLSNASARNNVLTNIYTQMVNEQLNEFSYAANLAGLGASLSTNTRGIGLSMGGYADGQEDMLSQVITAMTNVDFDQQLFKRIKRKIKESINNGDLDVPYQQTAGRTYKLLFTPYFTDQEKLDALESITLDDLISLTKNLYSTLKVIVLSHGNLTATQTLNRVSLLQRSLTDNADAARVDRLNMIKLPEASAYKDEMQLDHTDSSVSIYFQSLNRDRAHRTRYLLLRHMLKQPLYEELRTRQQLGYYVFTYSIDLIQVPSVVIGLQSPSVAPGKLYAAVEEFLADFYDELQNTTDDEIQGVINSLVLQIEEPDTRLGQLTDRYWSAVVREDYRFDATALFAQELRTITKAEMVALYRELFIDKNAGRLLVYSTGSAASKDTDLPAMTRVSNLESFKADKTLLPPLSLVPDVE